MFHFSLSPGGYVLFFSYRLFQSLFSFTKFFPGQSLTFPVSFFAVLLAICCHLDFILPIQNCHHFAMRYSNNRGLPQVCFSMQLDGPGCGYSAKLVAFVLDQYLLDPRHRWHGSEDDLIVVSVDYPPHILAYLQRKKNFVFQNIKSVNIFGFIGCSWSSS